ncbi:MAG TPA: type II toxin-antitoxin system HipA family toxin [Gammaproteobacteria bacterium]|nr:type II toxin-antitoxin system HipA family toxin [Gammaproteobacteria bacterium]
MAKTKPKPYKQVEKIEVYLWGNLVGMAALDPSLGYYAFAYDKSFTKNGIEIAPLHMPLNDDVYIFTDLPTATYKRLPAALADALPDDFGNALINRYLADNGIAQDQITPLDRLAYMGNRAMGALEFKPAHGPKNSKPSAIEMNSLVLEARKAVKGNITHDYHTDAALRSIIEVGTSAGGARAKAVIAWNSKTHAIQSGQVDAEAGFEHWLLKFDGIGRDRELGMSEHYGRIEYAYYLMATAAGIDMSESQLLEENGRAHFMTKRFDREGQHEKHHIQTLCAMNHLDYKKKSTNSYEQLFLTLNQLNLSHQAYAQAFKRMLFNVMSRNCDDHTKNISFLLKKGGEWELAPAYDITFAHNPQSEWTNQHLMAINGKFKNITIDDIMKIANQFDIASAKKIIDEVRDAIQRWPTFAKKARLSKEEIKRIQSLLILL